MCVCVCVCGGVFQGVDDVHCSVIKEDLQNSTDGGLGDSLDVIKESSQEVGSLHTA